MVLNHKATPDDDNKLRCEDIKGKIESGASGHGDHPIKVVQCIVANCSKEAEASDLILTPVLEHLAREMHTLDEKYMAAWRLKLCALDQEIEQLLNQASLALDERATEHKEDEAFEDCFRVLWSQLTTTSINLAAELKRRALVQTSNLPGTCDRLSRPVARIRGSRLWMKFRSELGRMGRRSTPLMIICTIFVLI